MAMVEMRGKQASPVASPIIFRPEIFPLLLFFTSPPPAKKPTSIAHFRAIAEWNNAGWHRSLYSTFPPLFTWCVYLPPSSALFTTHSLSYPSLSNVPCDPSSLNFFFFAFLPNQSMRNLMIWLARSTNPNSAAEWSFRWPTLRIKQLLINPCLFGSHLDLFPRLMSTPHTQTNKQPYPWALHLLNWKKHSIDKRINGQRERQQEAERERGRNTWEEGKIQRTGQGTKARQMQASNKHRIHIHRQKRHRQLLVVMHVNWFIIGKANNKHIPLPLARSLSLFSHSLTYPLFCIERLLLPFYHILYSFVHPSRSAAILVPCRWYST